MKRKGLKIICAIKSEFFKFFSGTVTVVPDIRLRVRQPENDSPIAGGHSAQNDGSFNTSNIHATCSPTINPADSMLNSGVPLISNASSAPKYNSSLATQTIPPAIHISSCEDLPVNSPRVAGSSRVVLHTSNIPNSTHIPATSQKLAESSNVACEKNSSEKQSKPGEQRPQLPFLAEIRALQTAVSTGRKSSPQPSQGNSNSIENDTSLPQVAQGPLVATSLLQQQQKEQHQQHHLPQQRHQQQNSITSASVPAAPFAVQPEPKFTPRQQNLGVIPKSRPSPVITSHSQPTDKERHSASTKSVKFELTADRSDESTHTVPDTVSGAKKTEAVADSSPTEDQQHSSTRTKGATGGRKSGLRLTEKSNMAALADMILPQLNEMQKNYLGMKHSHLKTFC
jgi:hypothetical protein